MHLTWKVPGKGDLPLMGNILDSKKVLLISCITFMKIVKLTWFLMVSRLSKEFSRIALVIKPSDMCLDGTGTGEAENYACNLYNNYDL